MTRWDAGSSGWGVNPIRSLSSHREASDAVLRDPKYWFRSSGYLTDNRRLRFLDRDGMLNIRVADHPFGNIGGVAAMSLSGDTIAPASSLGWRQEAVWGR